MIELTQSLFQNVELRLVNEVLENIFSRYVSAALSLPKHYVHISPVFFFNASIY
jgi:hypothetical protein